MLKKYSFGRTTSFRQADSLIAVLMVGALSTYLLMSGRAATPYASITADQGTLSGASLQTDSSASKGL